MATIETALSIEESLFERAEALAGELEIPRSRVFSIALEQFLSRHDTKKLLSQLNAVYSDAVVLDEDEEAVRRTKHREVVEGTW